MANMSARPQELLPSKISPPNTTSIHVQPKEETPEEQHGPCVKDEAKNYERKIAARDRRAEQPKSISLHRVESLLDSKMAGINASLNSAMEHLFQQNMEQQQQFRQTMDQQFRQTMDQLFRQNMDQQQLFRQNMDQLFRQNMDQLLRQNIEQQQLFQQNMEQQQLYWRNTVEEQKLFRGSMEQLLNVQQHSLEQLNQQNMMKLKQTFEEIADTSQGTHHQLQLNEMLKSSTNLFSQLSAQCQRFSDVLVTCEQKLDSMAQQNAGLLQRLTNLENKLSLTSQGLERQSTMNGQLLLELKGSYRTNDEASGPVPGVNKFEKSAQVANQPMQPNHNSSTCRGDSSEKQTSLPGRLLSRIFPSSSEVDPLVQELEQVNATLQADVQRLSTKNVAKERELQKLKVDLKEYQEKNKKYKQAIMAFKTQTEGQWSSKQTPSSVAHKFEKLFSTDRHNCRDAIMKSPSGKAVANDIFELAYEECQTTVLKELFQELFHHHERGEVTTVADSQVKIYGQLLCLKGRPLQDIVDVKYLTLQVLKRLSAKSTHDYTLSSDSSPLNVFVQTAVLTALDMVAMQPPMVIEYPIALVSEEVQIIQGGSWDENYREGEYTLQYYRPILYTNYKEDEASKLAHVKVIPKY